MTKKKSKEETFDKRKQKEVDSINETFDFLLWFCFWRKTMLTQLSVEAYAFYYDIENAIDEQGKLKSGYIEKISDINSRYERQISFKDVFVYADIIAEKDFSNAETLLELAILCQVAANNIDQRFKTNDKKEIISFVMSDWLLTEATNRAISSWVVKQGIKNPGAEAMKERHKHNYKIIKETIEAMNIYDLGSFRADKIKREKYFDYVRKMTDLTSEDRIFRISRDILKMKKTQT